MLHLSVTAPMVCVTVVALGAGYEKADNPGAPPAMLAHVIVIMLPVKTCKVASGQGCLDCYTDAAQPRIIWAVLAAYT